ncbi:MULTISPECIES: hypothetical protein [Bacillus amyloliquefaciens group]|uniref:hypothetical protein n=1 Tax=Bacillus amyloliquefaciens group TaxID=1938374 RepID=UPI00057BE6B3|nr:MULTISPECIES: hypothetical protein [Bacillus amyloliquefaciens group]AJK65472.1 hypothetical protein KHU1_1511 [Bacillus amyloliquefaciens KHG19]AXY37812.1 hypothetical protein D3C60_08615 [Bacillus velezensis]MBE7956621.1 hypothetical protein [Bacillus amyloliquefaciens]MEB3984843.1 hypothetical protein [Bacillus velezensis]MEC1827254.1 hypothetical protein [Bacillus velezensis]
MEDKSNAEPSPKVIKILTYIIPIVLIGLILVLKNINTAAAEISFYIVAIGVVLLVVFSLIKNRKNRRKN